MPRSRTPRSLLMASQNMQDNLLRVRNAAMWLLQRNLNFTIQEAEEEEWFLLMPAFEHALDMAMVVSPKVPVQSDWLIALTARQVWFMACVCCRYDLNYPAIPVHIPTPEMYNASVEPSPEHRARINPSPEHRKLIAGATAGPQQALGFGLTWALELIWDNRLVQGVQFGFGAGRANPTNGSQPAASRTGAGQEPHADTEDSNGDRSLECSVVGTLSDISEVPSGNSVPVEAHTTSVAMRAEGMKRAETIARLRQEISGMAEDIADTDPVLDCRFEVPDADPEAMALLWFSTGVSNRYPEGDCFPCSGRPWEVRVRRSRAILFFGPGFCHKAAILGRLRRFGGPAEIYAHFEGDFLHIGFTIPKDVVSTQLTDSAQVPFILFSTTKKFNTLARWARNSGFGHKEIFVDWIDFTMRQDSLNDDDDSAFG